MNALVSEALFLLSSRGIVNSLDDVKFGLDTLPDLVHRSRKECYDPDTSKVGNLRQRVFVFRLVGIFWLRSHPFLPKLSPSLTRIWMSFTPRLRLLIVSARMLRIVSANSW